MTKMLRRVLFQPDYFMSAQFAGVAVALRGGGFARAGIEVEVLPLAGAGEHAEEISVVGRDTSDALIVGSTEQNIIIPAQRGGAPVQAVASMFGTSPLALAGLPGLAVGGDGGKTMRIGVHADTVDLMKRLLPDFMAAGVVSVGREEKMGLLRSGELDAVQVRRDRLTPLPRLSLSTSQHRSPRPATIATSCCPPAMPDAATPTPTHEPGARPQHGVHTACTLECTVLHYTTLHYTTLHYTACRVHWSAHAQYAACMRTARRVHCTAPCTYPGV